MSIASPRQPETTAGAYLAHLKARGIDWLFANAGTDFAPIIESIAAGRKDGIAMPEAVAIAHETTAVAMAHGYWLVTGRPQAVMVHVNVGTANALMGLINASRDQVPMLFTSGRTPLTEGGRLGARDLPIHWGQEMFDQAGMLRELVKWDYELRYPEHMQDVVDRALSIAASEPRGPVYLSLPREALAERWTGGAPASPHLMVATSPSPDIAAVATAATLLAEAKRPLVIAGRGDASGFDVLGPFADACGVPVAHFWPARLAIPTEHPMHAGFDVSPWIEQADVILVLDMLVPWLPARHTLADGAKVIHVGPDPAFHRHPMRSFPGELCIRAGVAETLRQLQTAMAGAPGLRERRDTIAARIAASRTVRARAMTEPPAGPMTNAWVSHVLSQKMGEDAIVFGELGCDPSAMTFKDANSYFGHPIAGGLGWGVPAALGAKLALPERTVIACVGDGSYLFANPVASHQTAAALGLPILTVVFNNGVWNAVRKSTRALYPNGHAATANEMPLSSLSPSPAYEQVVAASGGYGERVEDAEALPGAIERALKAVRVEKRQALLNVRVTA